MKLLIKTECLYCARPIQIPVEAARVCETHRTHADRYPRFTLESIYDLAKRQFNMNQLVRRHQGTS